MIEEYRKKHIFAVAEFMRNYAIDKGKTEQEANELYTLGLLHDVGYAFLNEKDYFYHNKIGGEFLKSQNYKYWQEVYYHGIAKSPYQSEFLDILNWADMHIDSEGKIVSLDERLKEISQRYNVPIDKLDSKPIVDELKARGFE